MRKRANRPNGAAALRRPLKILSGRLRHRRGFVRQVAFDPRLIATPTVDLLAYRATEGPRRDDLGKLEILGAVTGRDIGPAGRATDHDPGHAIATDSGR